MKKFVVISDSHGRRGSVERISHLFCENDFIIHLGDGSTDMRPIYGEFPEKTYICRGNCDFSYGEDEFTIEAGGMSVFCCHGHRYGVKTGLEKLAKRAKELGCSLALYGHTHAARIEELDGVLCVNPGSISSLHNASYCYLVIHGGKATPTIVRL
ncbi:MAG: metallophosphoesterase [Clostridia bacterium]|nr:metallophosphoesterase [Clostridia bacterium]